MKNKLTLSLVDVRVDYTVNGIILDKKNLFVKVGPKESTWTDHEWTRLVMGAVAHILYHKERDENRHGLHTCDQVDVTTKQAFEYYQALNAYEKVLSNKHYSVLYEFLVNSFGEEPGKDEDEVPEGNLEDDTSDA